MNYARIIVNIVTICISIFNLVALIYLTKFAFKAKITGSGACVDDITASNLKFAKYAMIILWICMILSVVANVFFGYNK